MRPRAVVAGAIANKPGNGGEVWVRLAWVRALEELGFDVSFVEVLRLAPPDSDSGRAAVEWFEAITANAGLTGRCALLWRGDDRWRSVTGRSLGEAVGDLADADLLVDISANLTPELVGVAGGTTVFVDLDPGFTQVWATKGLIDLDVYDVWATVGANVGRGDCPVPDAGRDWLAVRQPVLLDDWPVVAVPPAAPLTTVGSLRPPYGPVEWGGRTHGLKVHELRRLLHLPSACSARLELALAIDEADAADRAALVAAGWTLSDPRRLSTPDAFRRFVQSSAGEWSVAQGAYVSLGTGWFSDRSLRYLASGRPVVVQDTGLGRSLPLGEGLVVFADLDGAVAAIDAVLSEPDRHGAAARRLAETYFTPLPAIGRLLERVGSGV